MNYMQEINSRIVSKNNQGKYSLFSTDACQKQLNTSENVDLIFDIIDEWNDACNLPLDFGQFLNNMTRDNENLIAFSRVYIGELETEGPVQSEEIVDIATNGLLNNGHINSSGVAQRVNSPSDVLSPLVGLAGWINLIGKYKNNNAVILYSLPKQYITDSCHFKDERYAKEIYNFDGNLTHIKPEYLIGMIVKNKDGIDVVLTKDQMLQMNNRTR